VQRVLADLCNPNHGTDSVPVISFDPPTRPTPDHPDQFELATHLRGRFHEISARFLITELEAGLALLDVADTSQNGGFKERRRALAREAYDVVANRLARIASEPIALTIEERDEIHRLHRQLRDRLGRWPAGEPNV